MRTTQDSRRRCVLTLGSLMAATIILLGLTQNASAQWSQNGTNVFYNGGNVGIGTANPDINAKLHVYNASGAGVDIQSVNAGGWSRLRLGTGTHTYGLFTGDSTQPDAPNKIGLYDYTANGFRMMIDSVGNVGIGTTSPDKLLTVQGSSNRRTLKIISDGDGVGYSGVDLAALTTTNIPANRTADFFLSMRKDTWYGGDGSGPSFLIETAGPTGNYAAPFTITPTNDILLNSGRGVYGMPIGNVGIGTASPAYKLDVAGYIRSTSGGFIFPDGSVQATAATGGASSAANVSAGTFGQNTGLGVYAFPSSINVNGGSSSNWAGLNVGGTASINAAGNIYSYSRICAGNNSGNCDAANGVVIAGSGSNPYGNVYLTGSGNTYFNGGNVGIGTNNPNPFDRLTVYRNDSNAYLRVSAPLSYQSAIGFSDDINGQDSVIYRPGSTRDLAFYTATASNVMYLTQAGNVGIGNNSPSTKLQVGGGTRIDGTNGRVYLGTGAVVGSRGLEIIEENATTFSIRHHDPNVAWQNIAINPYAGKVGIGTLTPNETLEVGGNIKVSASGTGAGNITAAGTIEAGNIKARYQDVAEWVPSSEHLTTGTVVVLDATRSNQVVRSTQSYDTRVAGVVSEQPGITLGESGKGKVLVATTGRVLVQVDATNGPIHIGDLLVTSDVPGVAMKSEPITIGNRKMHMPGTLIGKALEPLEKGSGKILVLLSLQ